MIQHMDHIAEEFISQDTHGLITKAIGAAAGSERLYVNIDRIPPESFSTKYHSHSQQEEFFYVLSGSGTLRLNDREQEVTAGDFIAKPGGKMLAHTFYNSGTEPMLILDIGTVEKEDTCYYPDEDVYLHKSNGDSRAFSGDILLTEWTSEPNQ